MIERWFLTAKKVYRSHGIRPRQVWGPDWFKRLSAGAPKGPHGNRMIRLESPDGEFLAWVREDGQVTANPDAEFVNVGKGWFS